MSLRLSILHLALGAALIVVLALIPPTPTVSYTEFLFVSGATFAAFFALSRVAKIGLTRALIIATACSCVTLFTAAVASIIIHGIGARL